MIDPTDNPYAPPQAPLDTPDPAGDDPRAVGFRKSNLGHEAVFRALGTVNILGSLLDLGFIAVASASTLKVEELTTGVSSWGGPLWVAHLFLVLPTLILIHWVIGLGLRQFQLWAFRGQMLLSLAVIVSFVRDWQTGWGNNFLTDFSITTGVVAATAHFCIFFYLRRSKARRITEPDYRQAVARSRRLKPPRNGFLLIAIIPFSIAAEWGLINTLRNFSHLIGWIFK